MSKKKKAAKTNPSGYFAFARAFPYHLGNSFLDWSDDFGKAVLSGKDSGDCGGESDHFGGAGSNGGYLSSDDPFNTGRNG